MRNRRPWAPSGFRGRAEIKRAGGYDPAKGSAHPDNHDSTLEHGRAMSTDELEMLKRFALAVCFTSPPAPSGISPRDKARAIESLIDRGYLGPHEVGPNRPTREGFDVLLEHVKSDVGAAFAAWRKAQAKVSRCSRPQSLDAAHGEAAAAETRYRYLASERDVIVKARNKVVGR